MRERLPEQQRQCDRGCDMLSLVVTEYNLLVNDKRRSVLKDPLPLFAGAGYILFRRSS